MLEFRNSEQAACEPNVNGIKLFRLPRLVEIIIQRVRIRHPYLTHVHLFRVFTYRGETPPQRLACLEHILLHCVSFTNACSHLFFFCT